MPTNRETSKPNGSARTGNGSVPAGANGSTAADSSLFGGIQQRVTSKVDEQKNRAADGLGGIADVIRTASNELRMENETLASYVDAASDQMRRLADQIREKGVEEMMYDVNQFARRRPALFIGGAFLVGIGIARFLKSTAASGDDRSYDDFSSIDPMTAGTGSPSYSGDLGETGGY
jgi:hypothetical protein